jgi:hypothetical protein
VSTTDVTLTPGQAATLVLDGQTATPTAAALRVDIDLGSSPLTWGVGDWIEATDLLIEKAPKAGPYFDGATTPDPLHIPSWTGTPGASASVLTAPVPAGWSASGGETAIFVTDDDDDPCVELIDPVGGGGGYLWVLNSVTNTPGVGRWVALGVDVKPLTSDQASRMRLYVRTQSGSTTVDEQYSPTGAGWTAGQWTRQVVSVQQTATANNIDAIVWPTDTPSPGPQFHARHAVVAFADTQEEAEALAAAYWDGDTPATSDVYYVWSGTPHNSVSYRVQGARTIKNWNAQFKNMTFKDFSIEPLRKDNV